MGKGWIYCLSNKAFPNWLKIGQTKNSPNVRADQLYSTGVPYPFKIEMAKKVNDYEKRERIIHSILEKSVKRINPKREFFEATITDVRPLFDLLDGEDYFEPSEDENIFLKHILMNGQRVKHIIDNKERIANYSKREELLHWNGTYVKMIDFAKLHIKDVKSEEKADLSQFQLEIDNTFVPLHHIMSNCNG